MAISITFCEHIYSLKKQTTQIKREIWIWTKLTNATVTELAKPIYDVNLSSK